MIYLVGIIGFFGGFVVGLMIVHVILRHRTREEILNDRSIHWTYGSLTWLMAVIGAYSFVVMYRQYFG